MRMKLGTAAFALCVGVSLLLASCQPGGGVIDSNLVGVWKLVAIGTNDLPINIPVPQDDSFNVQYVFSDNPAKSVVTTTVGEFTNKKSSTVVTGTSGNLKTIDLLVDENCVGDICIKNRVACVLEVLTFLNELYLYELKDANTLELYGLVSQNQLISDTIPDELRIFFASPDQRPDAPENAEITFVLERVQ